MPFITAYQTEKGDTKPINQDSLMIQSARSKQGSVGMFAVCDGMGGLNQGEVASSTIVKQLSDWFKHKLPILLDTADVEDLPFYLMEKIEAINQDLIEDSNLQKTQMGSTLTVILIVDQQYFTFQLGDSRAYAVGQKITQLTKDQSLVAREIARGMITEQQALTHPQRHVLLQCMGVQSDIQVAMTSGVLAEGEQLMLCTDGFYRSLTPEEIHHAITSDVSVNKDEMQETLNFLIQTVKNREETDDITALLVQTI
ncbi:Serine/threonine protein phosphatase PrpC [Gracilibacillus orientalis]|uniref:Serine/threonine protein phosphatase PrpC n=1 Tax=Gracilibacillus orientalis TaxID=334253 RepID=A0A1I4P4L1_9BACI|nr:protein phosphatase 2C domain-containing protein [Gracilibacillus orientalis]SFM22722.1 Serine/threonine protein phosphatase PrpC [Gracilibacillus orientalis]